MNKLLIKSFLNSGIQSHAIHTSTQNYCFQMLCLSDYHLNLQFIDGPPKSKNECHMLPLTRHHKIAKRIHSYETKFLHDTILQVTFCRSSHFYAPQNILFNFMNGVRDKISFNFVIQTKGTKKTLVQNECLSYSYKNVQKCGTHYYKGLSQDLI